MIAPDHDCKAIIEQLLVHEWLSSYWQPINRDIDDPIAHTILETYRPGNRIEAQHIRPCVGPRMLPTACPMVVHIAPVDHEVLARCHATKARMSILASSNDAGESARIISTIGFPHTRCVVIGSTTSSGASPRRRATISE